jgi:hypothetical protein
MNLEELTKIVHETRGRLWDLGFSLNAVASARLLREVAAELGELDLAPVSVTVRVVAKSGTVTVGDHTFSPGDGEKSRHVIVVDAARHVLVDPALDMVRLKDIHVDPLVLTDLAERKATSGFLKGHRELLVEHMGVTLKYKAHPKDTGWQTADWTDEEPAFLGLKGEILEALKG